MTKNKNAAKILALALALLLASSGAAGAVDILFETPQQTDPDMPSYLPASIPLKKMKLPIVTATLWTPILVSPDEDAEFFEVATTAYPMRYLGAEGDYFYVLTFENKAGYVKKDDVLRSTITVTFPQYPAGTYPIGRELTPGVETVDEDLGVASYRPGTSRPNSEVVIKASTGYYVRPLSGKTATVIFSNDPESKDVVKTLSFKTRAIVDGESGQYITVKNAVLYNAKLAPSALLKKYIDVNPDFYTPRRSYPQDAFADYGMQDLGFIENFM